MLSEDRTWEIVESYFSQYGPVHHQIESFNNFITHGLERIINEEPDLFLKPKEKDAKYTSYRISFSDVHVPLPTVTEEDRTTRKYMPAEARIRDLTYDAPILTTVTETIETADKPPIVNVHRRVSIGRIPIMLRSAKCHLAKMTKKDRIKAGECEFDHGGYFVVKGKERVLIAQIRGNYNTVMVLEQRPTLNEKFKFVADVRSMSEETGHSVLLSVMLGIDDRTLVATLPYISAPIPIGIVFKAMGFVKEQDIRKFINLECKQASRYLRYIILDSMVVNEKTDGEPLFTEENPDESWEDADEETREEYHNRMTQRKALLYIGQYTKHTLQETERLDYAKQIIDGELFPHMGILTTDRERAYYWGYMVNKLLRTATGMRQEDDRDHYKNKRVEGAGLLCYELTRQLFKKFKDAILTGIEKKKQYPDAMSLISKLMIMTKGFRHNFSTGNWGVPKNSYIRAGVSQILSRLSFGASVSNLRRLNIPVGKEAKNSKIRQINPSQVMFICPAECFDPNTPILTWDGIVKKSRGHCHRRLSDR